MKKDNFKNLDLNLLKLFSVVYEYKNLKRSSEVLFISPPAVSQNINKLRNHFEDELFVKTPKGFDSTPFADSLFESLSPILSQLHTAVNGHHEFDPSELEGVITIDMGQQIIPWLSPMLFAQIKAESPNVAFASHNMTNDTPAMLKSDQVDMAVQFQFANTTKDIYELPLGELNFVAIVREDHPVKESEVTIEQLLEYDFALVEMPFFNTFHTTRLEALIAKRGLHMKVAHRSSSVISVLDVARNSDLVISGVEQFVGHSETGLRAIKVSNLNEISSYPICAYIHKKNRQSKKHQWLYEMIKKQVSS
ncbi:LysR family transcriptional regulator [Vibrio splendidus]|uniref:LysR family transcriptional regulator n=1 Tax=Vibrio splendidus TaxID=29497 RepID=UPI00076A19D1|nr:LysR family transcriptional regulator [Vibrio splendidus]PHX05299.1 putative HTH-type transcriptional regulator YbdO [Vibrio splendidus]